MRLPILLKAAISIITRIPWGTLDALFATVRRKAEAADRSSATGAQKAQAVVMAILPMIPDAYRSIAEQIIRLLIEVWLILERKK